MPGWILVADPQVDDAMVMFKLLEHEGHRATVVGDGQEVLDLVRAEPFDLLLLDLRLRNPDCLEVVRAVKGDPGLSHVPVIITTDIPEAKQVRRCLEMGADDYLPKPVDPLLLRMRTMAGLLKKRLHDLEAESERHVRDVIEATAGMGSQAFVSAHLERLSRRTDVWGRLARALLRTAAQVQERDQALRDEVASLRKQLSGAAIRHG